jgi:hypothetical protein
MNELWLHQSIYRMIHLKTGIKKVHSWAQEGRRDEGQVLLCPLATIFCVKISVL